MSERGPEERRVASDALHRRVRAFARASLHGPGGAEPFDALAADIARFQRDHVPGFRRLVEASAARLDDAASIPAVPVDAFRAARVAAHPEAEDAARFETSGTTDGRPGVHPMRTVETYRELSLAWGRRALEVGKGPRTVVALAPPPGAAPTSSLGFMMRELMRALDGRGLDDGVAFDGDAPGRWLAGPAGVDLEGLRAGAATARARGEPVLLLATSFALVLLVDALAGDRIPLPAGSVVMTTGGFKGRTREVAPGELAREVTRALDVEPSRIVGEYGMTELTSQLYEGTLPGASLVGPAGVYVPPPWLQVTAVDPATLAPLAAGEVGLARFVDLGNVDSAVAIVTQDLVRCSGPGVALLGRRPGAPPRGCSLAVEQMVLGGGRR